MVDGTGLENRSTARYHRFESCPLRQTLRRALTRLPGAPELLARMNSPLVSTAALQPEPVKQTAEPAGPRERTLGARTRCAGGGGDFLAELERAEKSVNGVRDQLARLRQEKTQPAVADLWRRNPPLGRQEQEVENLLTEAQRTLDAGRTRRDLDQIFTALDQAADANSKLKRLLDSARQAAGTEALRLGGS